MIESGRYKNEGILIYVLRAFAFFAGIFAVVIYMTKGDYTVLLTGATPLPVVVSDADNMLSDDQKMQIRSLHMNLLHLADIDLRVVVLMGAFDADDVAIGLLKKSDAGARSKSKKGMILLVGPQARIVRLKLNFEDEHPFSDEFVNYVQNRQMSPFFRNNDIMNGIVKTVAFIVQRAQDDSEGKIFSAKLLEAQRMDKSSANTLPSNKVMNEYGSPFQVYSAFIHSMRSFDANSKLSFYSTASQYIFKGQPLSRDDMARFVRLDENCPPAEVKILKDQHHAIMRYPIVARECTPYFFIVENNTWTMDMTMDRRVIKVDAFNRWLMVQGIRHPYEEGFSDWLFDAFGYPQEE